MHAPAFSRQARRGSGIRPFAHTIDPVRIEHGSALANLDLLHRPGIQSYKFAFGPSAHVFVLPADCRTGLAEICLAANELHLSHISIIIHACASSLPGLPRHIVVRIPVTS